MLTTRLPPVILVILAAVGCGSESGGVLDGGFVLFPATIDFGVVGIGSEATQKVRVVSRVDHDLMLDIRRADSTPNVFEPSVSSLLVAPKGESSFDVGFAPDAEAFFAGAIVVSDDSKTVDLEVRGTVLTEDCFQVTRQTVEFGNVVVNTTDTEAIVLSNDCPSDTTVSLTAEQNVKLCTSGAADPSTFCIVIRDGLLDADKRFVVASGETVTMEAQFTPKIAATRERGSFTLATCDSAVCRHDVQLNGQGIESGFRCSPASVDFGEVSPGSCLTRAVTCENIANEQITVTSSSLVSSGGVPTSTDFEAESPPVTVLNPGEKIEIDVTYCPMELGDDVGTLGIETDNHDTRLRTIFIPLVGTGGGPKLEVAPNGCLDFGLVSTLAPARRTILVSNTGFLPVEITDIVADTRQTGAFTAPGAAGGILQPGDAMTIVVEFLPTTAGPVESGLLIRSSDRDDPELEICLRGEGVELPDCNFEVVRAPIDFGDVPPYHQRHQGVAIYNRGTENCLLTSTRLTPGSHSSFFMIEAPQNRIITPGSGALVTVGYAPLASGTHTGSFEFSISSPASPFNTVAITAASVDQTPIISPSVTDFGHVDLSCSLRTRTQRIMNVTSTPVTVSAIALTDVGPFTLESLPALPETIQPGATSSIGVAFDPSGGGLVRSAVRVTGQIDGSPFEVLGALRGESTPSARQIDTFDNLAQRPIDVLMVVDNSCSTSDDHAGIASGFASFIDLATTNSIDYRIGMTTASIQLEQGRLVHPGPNSNGEVKVFDGPVANKIITASSRPSPLDVFRTNLMLGPQAGGSSVDESGFQAAFLAFSPPVVTGHNAGLLRPEARLALLFTTDEPEQSMNTVDYFLDYVESLKGTPNRNRISWSAIAGDSPGGCTGPGGAASAAPRHLIATQKSGGMFESVCTSDWSATMGRLGDAMFGVRAHYRLTAPAVAASIDVRVDGALVSPVSPQGTAHWSYDPASNEVRFSTLSRPEPGATLQISYAVDCS